MRMHGLTAAVMVAFFAVATPVSARSTQVSVRDRFADSALPLLVVAHRACHNPAPHHGMATTTAENSLAGIARCIVLGVDVAEVDVRRTRDGYLVLMHDSSVERTTDGHGEVADLTLAQIRTLHLRQDEGGPKAVLTSDRVPMLDEALAAARGRILLNLDVQAGLYPDTVAAVRAARQEDGSIVKQPAGVGSPALAAAAPFDHVPFMPILSPAGDGSDLVEIATRQVSGRKPVAIELPRMTPETLPALAELARRAGTRLWINTLWEGFLAGYGGDVDALRDPDAVWGRLRRTGISVIQTDEPEALLRFLGR